MKIEPGLFDQPDPEAEARSIARARDDVENGRTIPHEQVVAWLRTWGTPEEHPAPREWFE